MSGRNKVEKEGHPEGRVASTQAGICGDHTDYPHEMNEDQQLNIYWPRTGQDSCG